MDEDHDYLESDLLIAVAAIPEGCHEHSWFLDGPHDYRLCTCCLHPCQYLRGSQKQMAWSKWRKAHGGSA